MSCPIKPVGEVATALSNYRRYNFLQPDVKVCLDPVLPEPGSDEEPDWLKLAREEGGHPQEITEYLENGDTKYRLSGLNVDMRFSVGDDDCANDNVQVRSKRDFLLFLEGLDWQ